MVKRLATRIANSRPLLMLALIGLGLFAGTRLSEAVSGGSGSGRLRFTKGTDPFSYAGGTGLTLVPGRSCTIHKASSTSSLVVSYYENVSAATFSSAFPYSSIHLHLNGNPVSCRQLQVLGTNTGHGMVDTPVAMSTAFTGGLPGDYTIQVFVSGKAPLNFAGRDVSTGRSLDYTVTIQEVP